MTHKGKQILWHKKRQKIIPAKFLKGQGKKAEVVTWSAPSSGDKLKNFIQQIKKAANDQE